MHRRGGQRRRPETGRPRGGCPPIALWTEKQQPTGNSLPNSSGSCNGDVEGYAEVVVVAIVRGGRGPTNRGRIGNCEARGWRLGRQLCWGGGSHNCQFFWVVQRQHEGIRQGGGHRHWGRGGAHPIVVESALANPEDGGTNGGFARGGHWCCNCQSFWVARRQCGAKSQRRWRG